MIAPPQLSRPGHPLERYCLWQLACLALLVVAIWINEAFDPVALFLGIPSALPNWIKASGVTACAIAFGLLSILPLYRNKRCSCGGSVNICSYCHKIQTGGKSWEQIEHFFADRTYASFSHCVCPDCCERVMTDYRNGKKNAGAREIETQIIA